MTSIQAQTLAQKIVDRFGPHGQFDGGVTVSVDSIQTATGQQPHPGTTIAGLMYRLLGSRDGRTGAAHTDFVAGGALWNLTDREVTLTPINAAADDFAAVIETMGGVAS